MNGAPAWIRNGRADVVATNALGRALYAPLFNDPIRPANTARFTFLSPGRGLLSRLGPHRPGHGRGAACRRRS